ncbi:cytochrome P450 [Colletotrichum graminicola M1.001]|uniref:Cytochrome P450 n=1 Tax=Colletotrichum graminicola (strain M1.001 / M2 / FGSC 10212) TaxID=645133 RepID=E3QZT1_COLGM|nr:cytochrome P450 [Colletotrichum graminicola M1.001]EFQ36369.1 cytochrome P450 [Colletotrichum graminicola M1.001]
MDWLYQTPERVMTTALGFFGVFVLVAYIASVVYEAFISPLSKYPAPIYCHVSHLPVAWHMWRGTHPYWLDGLHKRYGRVVRVSPSELSYTDGRAWKDIYGHTREGKRGCPKNPRFYGPVKDLDNGTPGILEADDVNHARFRRIFSHAFSPKALQEQEPIFQKYTTLLTQRLKEKMDGNSQGEFDLLAWYNYATFDVMADLTFGESLKLLETTAYIPWIDAIFNSLQAGVIFRSMRYWPLLYRGLRLAFGAKLREKRRVQFRYCAESVDRRLEKPPSAEARTDLWSLVLRHQEKEDRLTLPEMHTNSSAFMMAGTETTATACGGLTYYMLKHPGVMEKLVREIRTSFDSEQDITIARMQRLEYLQACINETLRVYPPSVTGFQRVTPPEGAEICGRFVPGGTSVYVSNYACFRSELNFKDPEKFIPERFLDQTGDYFEYDNRAALQPFSYGPRVCMGKHMAYVEIRMIMVKMLWNFDLKLCDEDEDWLDQPVFLVFKKRPLMVKVRPRSHGNPDKPQ